MTCAGTTTAPQAAETHTCCTTFECFEKPRFFCGQLLTDLDLEAAMSYMAAKNRLHNRYLFGAGVVCGLGVRCDACDSGSVVVGSGYALDCNGDDIIVCSDTPFDVQAYLNRQQKEKQADCAARKVRMPDDCDTTVSEYCLVISYEEKPAKPVNALVRDNGCRADRCEPSRTLERFRLDLIDKRTIDNLTAPPTLWSRIAGCYTQGLAKFAAYRMELTKANSLQEQQPIYVRMRADLLALAEETGVTHCHFLTQIADIDVRFGTALRLETAATSKMSFDSTRLDPANDARFDERASAASPVNDLVALYQRALVECLCNGMLIPCGDCCEPDYVVLACMKLDAKKNVINICNTVRTHVVTGRSTRFVLQPLFDQVGKWIEETCCPDNSVKEMAFDPVAAQDTGSATGRMAMNLVSSFLQNVGSPTAARTAGLYQKPQTEVETHLNKMNITVDKVTSTTAEKAFTLANLREHAWDIPPGSHVELVVAGDTVAAVKIVKAAQP